MGTSLEKRTRWIDLLYKAVWRARDHNRSLRSDPMGYIYPMGISSIHGSILLKLWPNRLQYNEWRTSQDMWQRRNKSSSAGRNTVPQLPRPLFEECWTKHKISWLNEQKFQSVGNEGALCHISWDEPLKNKV